MSEQRRRVAPPLTVHFKLLMDEIPRSLAIGPHLAVLSVGYVLFAYASVPEVVRAHHDVSFAALGLMMSVVLFAFGLVQFPGSRLIDRMSTI